MVGSAGAFALAAVGEPWPVRGPALGGASPRARPRTPSSTHMANRPPSTPSTMVTAEVFFFTGAPQRGHAAASVDTSLLQEPHFTSFAALAGFFRREGVG